VSMNLFLYIALRPLSMEALLLSPVKSLLLFAVYRRVAACCPPLHINALLYIDALLVLAVPLYIDRLLHINALLLAAPLCISTLCCISTRWCCSLQCHDRGAERLSMSQ